VGLSGYESLYRYDNATDRTEGDSSFMSADVIASVFPWDRIAYDCRRRTFVDCSRGQLLTIAGDCRLSRPENVDQSGDVDVGVAAPVVQVR